jgi:hypothetical protein
MHDLLLFLFKVTTGSILLYLCFVIFYRNDTFYLRNRIMLLLSMALPVIIPLISLTGKNLPGSTPVGQTVIDKAIISGININDSVSGSLSSLSYSDVIFWIWLAVAIALLLKTITSAIRTLTFIRKGEIIKSQHTAMLQ